MANEFYPLILLGHLGTEFFAEPDELRISLRQRLNFESSSECSSAMRFGPENNTPAGLNMALSRLRTSERDPKSFGIYTILRVL